MNTTLLSWWSIWNRNQAVGAGQVVLAAKKVIDTPFIAINADDYYGKEGFKVIHRLQEAVIMNEKIVDNRFDFLKSISIFLIVGWHVAQHSSILGGGEWSLIKQSLSFNSVVSTILCSSGQVAVSLFIMSSVWFLFERETAKGEKIVRLYLTTLLLSVVIYCLVVMVGLHSFSFSELVKELLTPLYTQYWFITNYCIFYLLIPLLNQITVRMSNNAIKYMIIAETI